ncbi:13934_t:CDS:2 [Entrophospora sp. SA101]|nr:15466_t:CDS:2 [Entrophospora sp. SA101]CAJ0865719.1 13934_t:CDS:2 [Entrophospora sp. SA101]
MINLTKIQQLAKEIIDLENLTKTEQKKRNDFKKALKFVLEKSDELEKIITSSQLNISEEMKEILEKIKGLKDKSKASDSKCQELEEKKAQKEKELEELKNTIIANNKIEKRTHLSRINELLEKQEALIENKTKESTERLEDARDLIIELKIIGEAEINLLCQKQAEITQLTIQLEEITNQGERQLTQIINNIGSINVVQGNVLIDDNIGEVEQQAQILQPPYGISSSTSLGVLVGGLLLVIFRNKGQLILDNTPEFLDYCTKSDGLVFFGSIGSGKTAILAMLAHELPAEKAQIDFSHCPSQRLGVTETIFLDEINLLFKGNIVQDVRERQRFLMHFIALSRHQGTRLFVNAQRLGQVSIEQREVTTAICQVSLLQKTDEEYLQQLANDYANQYLRGRRINVTINRQLGSGGRYNYNPSNGTYNIILLHDHFYVGLAHELAHAHDHFSNPGRRLDHGPIFNQIARNYAFPFVESYVLPRMNAEQRRGFEINKASSLNGASCEAFQANQVYQRR